MNAYLLTGDDRFLDAWRKQTDAVNAQKKTVDGQTMYPRMHGDDGWYGYVPQPYSYNARELYFLSMKESDRRRMPKDAWFEYLAGNNPDYPENTLRLEFARIRDRVRGMREDATTPDTRLADDPMQFNPASIRTLLQLMQGGLHLQRRGAALFTRLRYFDPIRRRAGIPQDVAALIEKMTDDEVVVTIVNVNQLESRTVIVQAGGYAEHQFLTVKTDGQSVEVDDSKLTVHLGPGSGTKLTLKMRRHVNQPTMAFPW